MIQGGPETVTQLLDMRWDHIMFTGGTRIGRIVAQAAAKYMTPITLELGGKCPVIIDESTNIEVAAKRILYGRQNNAGQVISAHTTYVRARTQLVTGLRLP